MSVDESADPPRRRQVLPDVEEGAAFFGHSILGLMQLYMPAFVVWFLAMHYAPPGFSWLGIFGGFVLAVVATAVILAAPDYQSPREYAQTVWNHYTDQGVQIHE